MTATLDSAQAIRVDIGIFAHNEEQHIGTLLNDLGQQDILLDKSIDLHIWILANGCQDATTAVARACVQTPENRVLAKRLTVLDFAQGGKSRTMHRYIQEIAREDTEIIGFMDADIRLPEPTTLSQMLSSMRLRTTLQAFVSRPVKDIDYFDLNASFTARLIAAGGGGLNDFRKSICGQLFMLRAPIARRIGLPTGLPVEDGFIRAMVVTDLLQKPENLDKIDGEDSVFHTYESIQSVSELIRHQTRIVVGSAVNSALFTHIRAAIARGKTAESVLAHASQHPDWLADVLKAELPRKPWGYVPFHFLTRRITEGRFRKALKRGPKGWIILAVGMALDTLVYIRATHRMMAGKAAGHW